MKVFLSWSGPRSKEVAEALRNWLPDVLHSVTPFMSSTDIERGSDFFHVLRGELQQSNFGILCLTRDKCRSPWVLFESGALAKILENSKLCPYLIDMKSADLPRPLDFFQAASSDKNGTWELVKSLNAASDLIKLSDERLRKSFDHWWPELKPKVESETKPLGPPADAQSFYLVNVKTATFLRAKGSGRRDGEALEVSAFSDEQRKIWRFHEAERGYYEIVSAHTNQCLDVKWSSIDEHAEVHQWQFNNGDSQKWSLSLQQDGSYKLRVKHSEYYLAATDEGIKQMSAAETRSQKWWLTPVFSY